jgi:hypothetical protein
MVNQTLPFHLVLLTNKMAIDVQCHSVMRAIPFPLTPSPLIHIWSWLGWIVVVVIMSEMFKTLDCNSENIVSVGLDVIFIK